MSDSGRTIGEGRYAGPPKSQPDLSEVRSENSSEVMAILCSDIHCCHVPPRWRSNEPDWYAAMYRPIRNIYKLAEKHRCPVIIAGDLNDRWNSPPELINWMISVFRMPYDCFAIPGQHDLPHHRYEDIKKSAYWTLVEAGVICDLKIDCPTVISVKGEPLCLHGFPWGFPIKPKDPDLLPNALHLAVIHDYCWSEGHSHPGAPEEKHWKQYLKKLQSYSAAVIGDNHSGFLQGQSVQILNSGSLMRRTSDQKDYTPMVGLLRADRRITTHRLATELDVTIDSLDGKTNLEVSNTLSEFMEILSSLGQEKLSDYQEACRVFMRAKKTPEVVQAVVFSCLEDVLSGVGK